MKSRWLFVFLCVLAGCGPREAGKARFKGTWTHSTLNGFTNEKSEVTVVVTADRDRFRIVEKIADSGESMEVFDGKTLYTKYVYTAGPSRVSSDDSSDEDSSDNASPTVSAKPMTVTETGSRRFWSNTLTTGHSEPGGLIAGRDTLLYKGAERRPDGEFNSEVWIDAKTGVLLKSVLTIYSSQVKSIVRQETSECQSIDYANIPETDFNSP